MDFKKETSTWFMGLQDRICAALELTDKKGKFTEDAWQREGGGGGRTRIIQNGNIIEKGGVAFSAVEGKTPERVKQLLNAQGDEFFATGVSIVLHPENPMVPIIHMNVRYFEMSDGRAWFGGGIDLTPHYVDVADAEYFHKKMKAACDKHHPSYYPEFKKWADDYFFVRHRNETRGIGGIFFDRLTANENFTMQQRFDFVKEVGETFAPTYQYFMTKNAGLPYGEKEKQWQLLRRGRYVEFNLVWDAGTKFGLETGGRTESILMSLPAEANWAYNFKPEPFSKEAETLDLLKKDIEWIQSSVNV